MMGLQIVCEADRVAACGAVFAMRLDNLIPFLIFGVIVLLAAVSGGFGLLSERRRRTALSQIAEQMDLSYTEDGEHLLAELASLPLFSRGRSSASAT